MSGVKQIIFILIIYLNSSSCLFKFDLKNIFGEIIHENPGSYFGYTVQLIDSSNKGNVRLLAGAPLAFSTNTTGALYSCPLTGEHNTSICQKFLLDLKIGDVKQRVGSEIHHHRREGQWLGSSLDVSGDGFVVCAPRWVNQIYAKNYFQNGLCYWMPSNTENTDRVAVPLKPLLSMKRQGYVDNVKKINYYYYAYGAAGMSVHIMKDKGKREILLGAPGVFQWKGTVIKYDEQNVESPLVPNPGHEEKIEQVSYFGYSVSSGRFFNDDSLMYVAGAPRGAKLYGQIFVFTYNQDGDLQITYSANGTKMGEYFGSSVAVTDFNGDGLDDIFVGAPTFSGIAVDAGRVYFFQSNGKGDFHRYVFAESVEARARFGTTITATGDLNKDGFKDIVVGAPFFGQNGEGAVFIYYGSKSDFLLQTPRRILATEVSSTLRRFGISISKAMDVDGNNMEDIAVGAYGTSQAVVIKQRPEVFLTASLQSPIKMIPLNHDRNNYQIPVIIHMNYSGPVAPEEVSFHYFLRADPYLRRTTSPVIFSYSQQNLDATKLITHNFTLKLPNNTIQNIEPLEFTLTYNLDECKPEEKFCPIDIGPQTSATLQVPFETGCGENTICYPDLKVEAVWKNQLEKYVVGSTNGIELVFNISNSAEPAFVSKMYINFTIPLLSIPEVCQNQAPGCIMCHIGNPLKKKKSLQLTFDSTKVKSTSKLLINASVSSIGIEKNITDNFVSLELPIYLETNIEFNGFSEPEQYSLKEGINYDIEAINKTIISQQETYSNLLEIVHQIEFRTKGPSPLRDMRLDIYLPHRLKDGLEFLTVKNSQATGNLPIMCQLVVPENETEVYPQNLTEHNNILSVLPKNRTLSISCDASYPERCLRITCRSSNEMVESLSNIIVKMELAVDLEVLDKNREFKDILILTTSAVIVSEQVVSNKYYHVSTVLVGTLKPSGYHWIWIVIGIIGGLILLTIVIAILYKLGFFKRRKLELPGNETEMIMEMELED